MSDNQDAGPLSIDQALDKLETSEETIPAQEAAPAQAPETEEADEVVETDDAEEVEAEEAEAPDEDDEGPQVLTLEEYGDVQIQVGEDVITLSDLQKGTLRQADYTRKTQELAEERKSLDADKAALADKQRQLDAAILNATGEEAEPDWAQMAEDDPLGYVTEKAKWDAKQKQREAALQAQQQAQYEQAANFRQMTAQKALEVFPSWSDADAFKAGEPARRKLAMTLFTPEEYDAALDVRMAALLEMAVKGQTRQTEESLAEKKIRKAPKVLRPGASKTRADREAADTAARKAKLRRPHSIEEALSIRGY